MIAWSRSLLEKLIVAQLVKIFLAFSGTPMVHYRIHKSDILYHAQSR
jgi:hypothetical protein